MSGYQIPVVPRTFELNRGDYKHTPNELWVLQGDAEPLQGELILVDGSLAMAHRVMTGAPEWDSWWEARPVGLYEDKSTP